MTRLLIVLIITLLALFVALRSWREQPRIDCSGAGLASITPIWEAFTQEKPRRAREELAKLNRRTRAGLTTPTFPALIEVWTDRDQPLPAATCQRVRESLKRLS